MNETSTMCATRSRLRRVLADYPDTLFLVDVVSIAGAKVETDAWGIDVCLTSTQKAFCAAGDGLRCGVARRAGTRPADPPGYYFDVLEIDGHHQKNNTRPPRRCR